MRYRFIYIGAISLIFFITSCYFYIVYKNNQNTTEATVEEIKSALDKSIHWVLLNQNTLLKDTNPALWAFLDESAMLTGNTEVSNLVAKYRSTVLGQSSVWNGHFVKNVSFTYVTGALDHMEAYQQFLIYGFSCNSALGEEEAIKDQLKINFCDWKPYYSSCSTHQLMGIRFLQRNDCGNPGQYDQLSDELADVIESQLVWDPRVGDVYIQRVLMLIESGHKDKIKPIWLKNILAEQRQDGGWANFYRLFNLTSQTEFGFGYKFPAIRTLPVSSFHTTAQAILLLSITYNEIITNKK